jgi:hypothetical protein
VVVASIAVSLIGVAGASAAKKEPLVVCKHGCKYSKIQKAVDASGKKDTIQIKPGTYREGVIVSGKSHNGLTIEGTKKNAKKVVLNGKGKFNNAIEGLNVNKLRILNLTARKYAANGIFVHDCADYLMKNVRAEFNRSYGLFAFNCTGGRMTKSIGFGHGDSAFYVGATPVQDDPDWTSLDHLQGYENVLGYSGTNSKYVRIHNSDFYNNGIGVVPNTLDSEPYEPNADGIIENNNIFWNNFNYFLPSSKVKTVSNGLGQLGDQTINYPTGVGIFLLGSTNWIIRDNEIFGNFKWGSAAVSDAVGNEGDNAISIDNQFVDNVNGRGGTDTNAVDFFVDGSGSGNCFSGNVSSTFDPSDSATTESLYPTCPAPAPPASGTGGSSGNGDQFGDLASYVLADPPESQECSWTKHEHPPFKKFTPIDLPGAPCN